MNKFKKAETELLKLVQSGRANLYQIAKKCVALFNESDDYADEIGIPVDNVVEHINERFLRDFAVELEEIIVLLKFFPNAADWNKPVMTLLSEAHQRIAAEKSEDQQQSAPRTRKAVKLAEFEEIQSKLADAEYSVKRERDSASKAISELDHAKERIRELEQENALLNGRIQELERIVGRQPADA